MERNTEQCGDRNGIVYEYMKYEQQKKLKMAAKPKKRVTFNRSVELVTYTENWKMYMIEGSLRSEEDQLKRGVISRRNY